jgi:hypothetical protein
VSNQQIASPRLPGGDLVAALFNRTVMALADRGLASNIIGDRWADIAAAHAATWLGSERALRDGEQEPLRIVRVERLDAMPNLAAAASRRGLQNPDLLIVGQRGERKTIQAADAKFSVETARAKQVRPDVVRGLLDLRQQVPGLLEGIAGDVHIEPGVFLAPDYPLTHLMLRGRYGIVRSTVHAQDVIFVPAPADHFWDGVEGETILTPLAAIDDLPVSPHENLMAGVYYFRLARAAIGFWLDSFKPLLLCNDIPQVDEPAVRAEAERRRRSAASAIELILRWDAQVQTIRNQRAAVEQAAGLPIPGRELRSKVERIAVAAGGEPPSINQARRRLGAWYRGELRERVGPLYPPVADLPAALLQIAAASRDLAPRLEVELERIVREMVSGGDARDAAAIASTGRLGESVSEASDFANRRGADAESRGEQ